MGKETEQLGKDIAKGLVSELAQTDGMKRRAAALLAAQSMDYNFKDPAVARVATNKSSMGVALANLYNTGGHKIPELADLGLGPGMAPNVGRVIDKKSRMGRRLTELYTKRNEDDVEKKEKSEAVEEADRIEEKKIKKEDSKRLKSIDENQEKLIEVNKKGFTLSTAILSGLGAKLMSMGKGKGNNNKLWAGGLAGLAGIFGAGDDGNLAGQLINLLPDNVKEMFTGANDMLGGLLGKDTMKSIGPMLSNILLGGAGASLFGFTPGKMLGGAANMTGASDLLQGNFMSSLVKGIVTSVLAALGYRYATSEKGPIEQFKEDFAAIKEFFGKAGEIFSGIWEAVKSVAATIKEYVMKLITALNIGFGYIKRLADKLAPEEGPDAPKDVDDILYGRKVEPTPNMSDWFAPEQNPDAPKDVDDILFGRKIEKPGDMADWYTGWQTGDEKLIDKVPPRLVPALRNALQVREKIEAQRVQENLKVSPNPTLTPTPERTLADLSKLEDKNSRHNPIIIQGDTNVNNVKGGGGQSAPSGTQVNPGAGSAFDPYENFLQMSVYGFGS